jgi:hypothetical protein
MKLDVIAAEAATGAVPGRDFVRTGALTAPGAANAEGPAAYLTPFGDGDEPADFNGDTITPQARGIRFNELISEVLVCWSIESDVSTSTAGAGEIDVNFSIWTDPAISCRRSGRRPRPATRHSHGEERRMS